MSVRLRLVGVALALLAPGLVLVVWTLNDGSSVEVSSSAVPSQVGPWSQVAEERLEDRILAVIGPSSYVARTYEAEGSSPVALYAGFYTGRVGQSKAPHDPEVCFPSAGWETLAVQRIDVPVSADETLRAWLLDTHKGSERQLVLYWFQPADRWPRGVVVEELMFLFDAVAGRPQYAFVRLVAGVPDAASRSAVLDDLLAFAGGLARPLRDAVTGAPPATARSAEVASGRERDREQAREF